MPDHVTPRVESPDIELMLLCCRPAQSEATVARIAELARGGLGWEMLDWEMLVEEAVEQGVVSLIYPALKAYAAGSVPVSCMDELRAMHVGNAGRTLLLSRELCRLLEAFAKHNIRAIPVKGPALAAFAYGSLVARKAGDLDILIPKDRVEPARELLQSLGYAPDVSPSEAAMKGIHHLSLVHPQSNTNVELHWSLNPEQFYFPIGFEELWSRQQKGPSEVDGAALLATEDMLIYLCSHGARHAWRHLLWVADIAFLIDSQAHLDWDIVLQRAKSLRSTRVLNLGLALARDQLGIELPPNVSAIIEDDRPAMKLAALARRSMFRPPPSVLRRLRFVCATRESFFDRLRYARYGARRLFRPNEADRGLANLPAGLALMYYLLRPLRLLVSGSSRSTEMPTVD